MSPKVGLVTVTYNSESVLEDFLESFYRLSGVDAHLYVVDNASSDGTRASLDAVAGSQISVIRNRTNTGIAVGNNQGIAAARDDACDWILLINNDTTFDSEMVAHLVDTATTQGLKILSPVIAATNPPGSDWYSDGVVHPWRAMQAKHVGMGSPLVLDRTTPYPVNYASTCALLIHSAVFRDIGLMDPMYFVYGDDVDFCIRATRAGYGYYVDPGALLTHKASSLTGEFTGPFAARWISRNWVVVARRHANAAQKTIGGFYIAAWTLARFLTRRDTLQVTRWRVAAYREGMKVDLSAAPPRLENMRSNAL
jgi:GT2 family glycosyltransferase